MKTFTYTWVDFSGMRGEGHIEAGNRAEAYKRLRNNNLTILRLREQNRFIHGVSEVNTGQPKGYLRSRFYRQGALLIRSGLPISDVVELLPGDLNELKGQLDDGVPLSEAMKLQKNIFGSHEIAMIKAGEDSGALEWSFSRLADDFYALEKFQKNFKQAMLYPICLLFISVIVLLFVIFYILPTIFSVFRDMDIELPLPAKLLMSITDISAFMLLGLIGLVVGLGLAAYCAYKNASVGVYIDNLMIKLPVVGRLWLLRDLSRFLGTLSMLLEGGIVIDKAVAGAASACSNRFLQENFREIGGQLARGSSFYSAIEGQVFPELIKRLVAAGEASGELPVMLNNGSQYCQEEGERQIRVIEILAEPVLLIILGGITGFIVLSIILPMLDIMTAFF